MQEKVAVFCAVIGVTIAAVGLGRLEPTPEKYKHVEGCYIGELDVVISIGESRPSTENCMEYRCSTEWVHFISCGAVAVSPPYKLVEDLKKPYPECCPRLDLESVPGNTTIEGTNKV